MRNLRKNILGLCLVGMGLGAGASAQAATGVGPYYAMPSWNQTLPAATRFIVLTNMNSEAVLDRETGLVWEQSPSSTELAPTIASVRCIQLTKGGRNGWRLPTIQELASLIDLTVAFPGQKLPPDHPFKITGVFYYSATALFQHTSDLKWGVDFIDGQVIPKNGAVLGRGWCVRGGQGPDAQ